MTARGRRAVDEASTVDMVLSATAAPPMKQGLRRSAEAPPPSMRVSDHRAREAFIDGLLAERTLAPIERLVGVRLARFLNLKTGQLNPSFETIAGATGMSIRTAKRHVQTLVDAGWIVRRSKRGRVSNEYALTNPTVPTDGTVE